MEEEKQVHRQIYDSEVVGNNSETILYGEKGGKTEIKGRLLWEKEM